MKRKARRMGGSTARVRPLQPTVCWVTLRWVLMSGDNYAIRTINSCVALHVILQCNFVNSRNVTEKHRNASGIESISFFVPSFINTYEDLFFDVVIADRKYPICS